MRDLYIKTSDAFVVVYSITSPSTFDQVHQIYNQIMDIKVKIEISLLLYKNNFNLNRKVNQH